MDNFKELLLLLDPNKSLSIYTLLEYYQTDPLVKEYIDNIADLKIMPKLPSKEDLIQTNSFEPKLQLQKSDFIGITTNMMTYFQSLYFSKNLDAADKRNIGIFNPKFNFKIPAYDLLPMSSLAFMGKAKEDFVLQTQRLALDGAAFQRELLLLRNFNFIKGKLDGLQNDDLEAHIKHFSNISIMKAQIEFTDKYKVKVIDWDSRDTKVTFSVPGWRKRKEGPPIEPRNFCAKSLAKKFISEDLSATTTSSLFQNYSGNLQIINGRLVSVTAEAKENLQTHHTTSYPENNQNPNRNQRNYTNKRWNNNNFKSNNNTFKSHNSDKRSHASHKSKSRSHNTNNSYPVKRKQGNANLSSQAINSFFQD